MADDYRAKHGAHAAGAHSAGAHAKSENAAPQASTSANSSASSRHARLQQSSNQAVRSSTSRATERSAADDLPTGYTTSDYRQPTGYQHTDFEGPMSVDDRAPESNHVISQDLPTIGAGQGAKVTTRQNASEAADIARANAEKRHRARHGGEAPTSRRPSAHGEQDVEAPQGQGPVRTKKNMAVVIAGTLAVFVVLLVAIRFVVSKVSPGPAEQAAQIESEAAMEDDDTSSSEVEATAEDSLTYGSLTFTLEVQESGCYGLVQTDEGNNVTVITEIEGEPAAFIIYNGVIVIPENLDDGWDVIAYVVADGSSAINVVDSDGNAVTGSGQIESATLDGSVLVVTDSTGATTDVSLE